MKISIILVIILMMGISSVTYADNDKETNSMVTSVTTIEYSTKLLERSVETKQQTGSCLVLFNKCTIAGEVYHAPEVVLGLLIAF